MSQDLISMSELDRRAEEEATEERLALAKMEAEHAATAAKRALTRGTEPPTPEVAYGHIPLPARGPMEKVSEWMLTEDAHIAFANWCACEHNKRMQTISEMFARDRHLTWMRYFTELAKCKNLSQWRARLHAVKCPIEGTMAARTPMECDRLLALMYMASVDEVPTADLRSRDHWVTEELAAWVA